MPSVVCRIDHSLSPPLSAEQEHRHRLLLLRDVQHRVLDLDVLPVPVPLLPVLRHVSGGGAGQLLPLLGRRPHLDLAGRLRLRTGEENISRCDSISSISSVSHVYILQFWSKIVLNEVLNASLCAAYLKMCCLWLVFISGQLCNP